MMNCLIIEDEPNARQVLLHYLDQRPDMACLGAFETGSLVTEAQWEAADLLFLDIELPEMNGLDFLKTVTIPPLVIVTTAYTQFAVQAFEQAVVDYLVKPFSQERFAIAVDRVTQQLQMPPEDYLFVYADKTTHKLKVQEIQYVKSELDYISIVTDSEKIMLLGSLVHWEKKLAEFSFDRIHRSYIVNRTRVDKVRGQSVVVGTTELPLGGVYRKSFLQQYR